MNNIPAIPIPKNQVIKLVPDVYFCKETRVSMDLDHMSCKTEDIINTNALSDKQQSGHKIIHMHETLKAADLKKKKSFLLLDDRELSNNDKIQKDLEDL